MIERKINKKEREKITHLASDGVSGEPGEDTGDGDDGDHGDHVDRRVRDLVDYLLNEEQIILRPFGYFSCYFADFPLM